MRFRIKGLTGKCGQIMLIPPMISHKLEPWPILPPGIHLTDFQMIRDLYATDSDRDMLFQGLLIAAKCLAYSGCRYLYLNGSFVTGKPTPGDYDACWDPQNVIFHKLLPILHYYPVNSPLGNQMNSRNNKLQKFFFLGEFYPSTLIADGFGNTMLDFFQTTEQRGTKGIIKLDLLQDPMI